MAQPPRNHKSPEGNPKAASTRLQLKGARALAGQRKHDLRIGRQPDYVDEGRKNLNRIIMEPDPPGMMRAICEGRRSLRETRRKMKKDASVAACGIITFGTQAAELFEALTPETQDAAFLDLAEAVADRLNTTLHGLVVHRDETTIHAHYQIAAYNRDGVPLSQATRPAVMSGLQDLTAEVMARHCPGIERGTRYADRIAAGADFKDTLHRTVRQLHADLPVELAAKEAEVAAAAARVEEMRARVEKLEAKAQLTDKEAKRLETYQARLSARIAEQEAAQAEATRLAQVARDDAAQAAQDRDAARAAEEAALAQAAEAEARRAEAEEDALRVSTKAGALLTATAALTAEMTAGTLRRTSEGKIQVQNRKAIQGGLPDLAPALRAATDATEARRREEKAAEVAKAERARAEAEADGARAQAAQIIQQAEADRAAAAAERQEAATANAEIQTLRDRMLGLMNLLKAGLKRVGDYLPKAQRAVAENAIEQAVDLIALTDPKAKKPSNDTGTDLGM